MQLSQNMRLHVREKKLSAKLRKHTYAKDIEYVLQEKRYCIYLQILFCLVPFLHGTCFQTYQKTILEVTLKHYM